jgi:hypothetical protein
MSCHHHASTPQYLDTQLSSYDDVLLVLRSVADRVENMHRKYNGVVYILKCTLVKIACDLLQFVTHCSLCSFCILLLYMH